MNNSKVINLLKCLSRSEFREFGKFVSSNFHNNRKDVVRYYDVLKSYYPEFNSAEISSEQIFKKLYKGKKFDSNTIILLNAYLYNLAKEYLVITELKNDKFLYKYQLLKSLDNHFADGLFEKEYRNAMAFLNTEKLNDDLFKQKSMLEELNINYNLKRNRQGKMCQNAIEWGDLTIYSFIIKLVGIYNDLLANKSAFNFEFSDSATELFIKNFNIEEFVKEIRVGNKEDYDYLLFSYYVLMCNYYPDVTDYFSKLKESAFKNFEQLQDAEKSSRFHLLINYCIYQMELGKLQFLRESFELYKKALEKNLFFKSDLSTKEVGVMFFRNFVTIGLAVKELEDIEKFIFEYGDRIKGDGKDDLLELSYAMLNYEKKNYDEALEHLSRVSNAVPLFRLSTKYILLKIYYDTNQLESFFPLVDTYRHYLKNEKIIPARTKEVHSVLLGYAGRLARIKMTRKYDDIFPLKKEIENDMSMDFRHKLWLMEKAGEIIAQND